MRPTRAARFATALGLLVVLAATTSPTSAGDPVECDSPLDAATLDDLTLQRGMFAGVQPGQTRTFTLGVWECCVFLHRVPACAEWTVDPPGAATLELLPWTGEPLDATGRVTVGADVPHGTVITLRADVEDGRKILTTALHVYTPEANPLVGYWRERGRLPCVTFRRGDVDQNGSFDITDAIATLEYLFGSGDRPSCLEAANANGDGRLDISDPVFSLRHLFAGGRAPPPPFDECGIDIEPPSLGCRAVEVCDSDEPPSLQTLMEELVFDADGRFTVTWIPFEVYVDYWGTYTFDLRTGALELELTSGNFIPDDFRVFGGRFAIEEDEFWLENLWLGVPADVDTRGCGHVFTRR